MNNLYDLEQKLAQQRCTVAPRMAPGDTAVETRLPARKRSAVSRPALRTRLGLLLIRLGARLAA